MKSARVPPSVPRATGHGRVATVGNQGLILLGSLREAMGMGLSLPSEDGKAGALTHLRLSSDSSF